MGFAIAAAVAASGAVSYMGSQQAASGAQGAAKDQLAQADSNRRQALDLSKATPQELAILSKQYDAASQHLDQQQKLMSSIDPALMEASKQALSIMQGGNAASTQPMFAMRNQQRSQLIQSLRSQYGPGAESTSIGQRALQQFDMQTQSMQTGQLGNLMNMAESGGGPGLTNALSSLGQVGQGYGNIQQRQIGASLGTAAPLVNAAGASFVGQTLGGQANASLGNNLMNAGTTLYGSMYGAKPTTTTNYNFSGGGSPYGSTSGGGNYDNALGNYNMPSPYGTNLTSGTPGE